MKIISDRNRPTDAGDHPVRRALPERGPRFAEVAAACAVVLAACTTAASFSEPGFEPHDGEGFWWTSISVATPTTSTTPQPEPAPEASVPTTIVAAEPESIDLAIEIPGDVLFAPDEHELAHGGENVVGELAHLLSAHDGLFHITCHTDDRGTAAYNQELSERRAESLRAALRDEGVENVSIEGRGESNPTADNTTETGRALNRRCTAERVDVTGGR